MDNIFLVAGIISVIFFIAKFLADDDEAFNDLVGEDTSGLNDLSYSSAKDNEDCVCVC